MDSSATPPLPRDARLLLWGVAVDAFGTGLTLPLLVVYLHQVRGIPLETVGLVVAVPAAVALVLLAPIGVLIDGVGPRRVQMVALVGAASGALVLSRVTTVPLAFVARVLTGIGHAAFFPANQSLVSGVVPSPQRQRYFGVAFALLNAGIGVGGIVTALFVDVTRPATFAAVYVADALTFLVPLALLAGPLHHVGGPAAETAAGATGSYRDVLRDPVFRRVLALVFVSAFVGYGQVEGGWTAYANTVVRASTRTLGLAFAVNTAVIVALQLVVLRLIEGRRRSRLLVVVAALWGLFWIIMGLAGLRGGTPLASLLLIVAFAVFAAGETLLSPIMPAITNDVAPERLRGRYNAAAVLAFQAAAVGAPAIAGFLLGRGLATGFVVMLLAGCALFALSALRLERHIPAHADGVRA